MHIASSHKPGIIASLPVFLVFSAIAVMVVYPVQDFDIFWHIANGRAMVESGQIINQEIFSYTSAGRHFNNHAWLSQIIFFLIYNTAGANGLIAVKALLTMLTSAFVFVTCRGQGLTALHAALLCFLGFWASQFRYVVRPHLFSYLFLSMLAYILFSYRRNVMSGKILWLMPVIMLLWDIMHGAIYGLILLGAFLASETAKPLIYRTLNWPGLAPMSDVRLKKLWIYFGATILLMLISPYGLLSYDIFIQFVSDNLMTSMTAEFQPPTLSGKPLFWIFLAISTIFLFLSRKNADLTSLVILIPFSAMAMRYVRGIGPFCIIAAVITAVHLPALFEKMNTAARRIVNITLVVCLFGSLIYTGYYKFFSPPRYDSFGTGLNSDSFPEGSARFVKAVGLEGNMYNTDRYGGYLAYFIYPERKIFHYNHHMLFDALEKFVHEPQTREKWQINYAIIGRPDEWDMFERDGYVPIYWEPTAAVMVKNNESNRPLIQRYKLKYFSPIMPKDRFIKLSNSPSVLPRLAQETADYLSMRQDKAIADNFAAIVKVDRPSLTIDTRIKLLNVTMKYNKESASINAVLGSLLYKTGKKDEAKAKLLQAVKLDDSLKEARFSLAYLNFDQGDYAEAESNFKKVLAMNPKHPDTLYGLGLTYSKQNRNKEAKSIFQQYIDIAPNSPWAQNARNFIAKTPVVVD